MSQINIGSKVRSYDFPNNYAHYVYGEVVAMLGASVSPVGYDCYQIAVEYRVEGDAKVDSAGNPQYVFVPLNGSEGMFGPTNGVVRVS